MLALVVACSILQVVYSQKPSPCPEVFTYETRRREQDRWYGVVALKSPVDLNGIWLKIALDEPAELLGNWFGESFSRDNQEFTIKNPKYKLEAGPPVTVRFFVKYNVDGIIPSVKRIQLNGRVLCDGESEEEASTTNSLHISQLIGQGQGPNQWQQEKPNREKPNQHTNNHHNRRTTTTTSPQHHNKQPENEDFFPGDFALHRPQSKPSQIPNRRKIECGTIAMKASPLISHGQNTTKGQWPWHAALYLSQGAQLVYTCGGTLISENHVLTAAHCVTKPQTNKIINIDKLTVYLGKYSLKKFGSDTQDKEVAEIHIHPSYNSTVFYNDIAILKLKDSIDITNYVRPCCLWEEQIETESIITRLGTVVGWGFDENRQLSDSLIKAEMPVVSTVDCIYSNRDFFSQFTFEKTYCAGFRNGTTVCNGDSGGGMVFPKTGSHGKIWHLRGIVSVGVALQGQGVCDPSHYIVFTDVAKHLRWIQQTADL